MKIALVCPASLPATQFGGIVFLAVDLAHEISKMGHDVTIYTTDLDFSNGPNKFNKNLPRLENIEKFKINRTHVWFSLKLFFFMSLPTMIGVLLRSKFPKYIENKTFGLDRAALFLFLFIIFYAIYTERFNLKSYFDDTGGISFVIVFLILIAVFTITNVFIDDTGSKRAIRIEALLQNGAMGIVVGAQIFDKIAYITPIAIYALIQYIVLIFYIGNINIAKKNIK